MVVSAPGHLVGSPLAQPHPVPVSRSLEYVVVTLTRDVEQGTSKRCHSEPARENAPEFRAREVEIIRTVDLYTDRSYPAITASGFDGETGD